MKKLVKIAMALMLLMMPVTLFAQSASEARKTLKDYCEVKNAECPIKDGGQNVKAPSPSSSVTTTAK